MGSGADDGQNLNHSNAIPNFYQSRDRKRVKKVICSRIDN